MNIFNFYFHTSRLKAIIASEYRIDSKSCLTPASLKHASSCRFNIKDEIMILARKYKTKFHEHDEGTKKCQQDFDY